MDDIITIEECITRLDAIRHEIVPDSRDHFALSAGIAALYEMEKGAQAVNQWISVEDDLPDALQNVLVCTDINTVTVAWINGEGWTFADTGCGHTENYVFDDVKYWMHLPEPPKGEQK